MGPRCRRGFRRGPQRAVCVASVCSRAALAGSSPVAQALVVPREVLPLRTHGRFIVDAAGQRLQLACVNWYGAHQPQMVMNGLNVQPIGAIAATIARLGFNCVRLPFSLDMLSGNMTHVPEASLALQANPELQGLSPLALFDETVSILTHLGLLVILNQHVSSFGWCCSRSDGEGLWYTKRYPEQAWLDGLAAMARRYRLNPWVVGFDLRNEVRPSGLVIPLWGTGEQATDWSLAAVRGAKSVLAESPDLLIFVSGIMYGVRLVDVRDRPIHVTEPELRNRTIYSTHYYYGWCFDLVAKDLLLKGHWPLLLLACWLWALLAADAYTDKCKGPAYLHRYNSVSLDSGSDATPSRCQLLLRSWRRSGTPCSWEWIASAVLLALLGLFLVIGKQLELTCGHIHILSPPFFAVLADIILHISFVIWARLLLAYTAVMAIWGNEAPHQLGDPAAATGTEPLPHERSLEKRFHAGMGDTPPEAAECRDKRPGPPLGASPHAVLRCLGALCGPKASRRLAQPMRAHRFGTAAAPLALLAALRLLCAHLGSYDAFAADLGVCWGFLLHGEGVEPAPVWLSEFGTEELDLYWSHLMRFMREQEMDFAYWSINGEKERGQSESYGILNTDSATVRDPLRLQMLQELIIPREPAVTPNISVH